MLHSSKPSPIEGQAAKAVDPATPLFGPVIVVPLSTSEASFAELRAAGYVPVACDTPDAVRVIMPGSQIESGDMLMSALHGVVNCGYITAAEKFTDELFRRMTAREASK